MKASLFVLSVFAVGFVRCQGNEIDNEPSPSEDSVKRALSSACGVREPSSCIALELVGYVDRMLRTAALQISDDLLLVDDSNGAAAEQPAAPESLARAGSSPIDQAQSLIADKLWNFATTRSLRYRLVDDSDLVVSGRKREDGSFGVGVTVKRANDVESARRRRPYGPIFAAAAMKIGLMGALAFKGLTLLVGKALLIGKIALLLAGIIGLKKLFSNQD